MPQIFIFDKEVILKAFCVKPGYAGLLDDKGKLIAIVDDWTTPRAANVYREKDGEWTYMRETAETFPIVEVAGLQEDWNRERNLKDVLLLSFNKDLYVTKDSLVFTTCIERSIVNNEKIFTHYLTYVPTRYPGIYRRWTSITFNTENGDNKSEGPITSLSMTEYNRLKTESDNIIAAGPQS